MKQLLTILCLVLLVSCSPKPPPDGPYTKYYPSGQIEIKGNVKDGIPYGLTEKYYENGQLKTRGNIKNGKPDGLWETFDEDGNLTETRKYKNGNLVVFSSYSYSKETSKQK